MKIVPYQEKYRKDVQAICLDTSRAKGNPREEAFVLAMYCSGYLTHGIAWVLLDDREQPQGYILCAPEYRAYRRQLKESMKEMDLFHRILARIEGMGYAGFSGKYPAHLHVDIRQPYTGQGSGARLMAELMKELKKRQVPGVMLCVSAKNHRAIRFYNRQGFRVLKKGIFAWNMGCDVDRFLSADQ